jgi:hypothetical protein
MISIPTAVTLFVVLVTLIVYLDRLVGADEEQLAPAMGPTTLAEFRAAAGLDEAPSAPAPAPARRKHSHDEDHKVVTGQLAAREAAAAAAPAATPAAPHAGAIQQRQTLRRAGDHVESRQRDNAMAPRTQTARRHRAFEAALRDLASQDPARIDQARVILLELAGEHETAILQRLLKSQDPRLARRAAELLFRVGNEEILPDLADFLRKPAA